MTKKIILLYLIVSAIFSSCKKFVDIPPPGDRIISEQVFKDSAKATSAVTAIYGNMINGSPAFCNSLVTIYGGLSSDEMVKFNPTVPEQEFISNQLNPANSWIQNIWTSAYKHIYYVNAVIEGVETSTDLSISLKTRLLGEVKFIRAFCYFYLMNLYGDVPLITGTDYKVNAVLARSAKAEVRDLIISDLMQAKNSLSDTYITTGKVRPNKWAAAALLSRVYLYEKEWSKAEVEANEVINSGIYTPLETCNKVFLKNSKEAIWQLVNKDGYVPEIVSIVPLGAPQIVLSSNLLNSFELGDERRIKWVDSTNYNSQRYYYPGKYKDVAAINSEYYMVLRVAEQYLIRSEARARQNNLTGAIQDLNILRARALLPSLVLSLTQAQTLAAIEQERKVELFAEWANRWLDLIRTEKANSALSGLKSGWQSTDILYPVPQSEILSNTNLIQNDGY